MLAELARRGISHPNAVAMVKRSMLVQSTDGSGQVERFEVPTWGAVLLSVSFWVAMVAVFFVSYMLHEVVATLSMVESPTTAIVVNPSTHEAADKEEKEGLLEAAPSFTVVNQKPITSSIRGTIRHLVAEAGRGARFRGVMIYMSYNFLTLIVSTFFRAALPRIPGQAIFVAGLTGAILANLHSTWTHKVVSMPTDKSFCQRFRAASQWKTLALPAAIEASMPYVALYLSCGVAMLLGLHKLESEDLSSYTAAQAVGLIARILVVFVFVISCSLFLCLPAIVTLVRIEASILPEDQDTIVPFDRTFGGKVMSKLMGGTGKVGFLDAWRSFNWEARRRLIKLFVKIQLLITGMIIIIAHVLLFEVFLVMRSSLDNFLIQAKAHGWVQ